MLFGAALELQLVNIMADGEQLSGQALILRPHVLQLFSQPIQRSVNSVFPVFSQLAIVQGSQPSVGHRN